MNTLSKQHFALFGLVILLTITHLIYLSSQPSKQTLIPPKISGTILINPYKIIPFTLIDQNNKIFNNQKLTGNWHLVSYGYLHCPDVCPTTLILLSRIKEKLTKNSYSLNYLFYSVDPTRDRPNNLKQYLSFFDDEFIGLTHEDTSELNNDFANNLGIKADIKTITDNSIVQIKVSHGVHLFLINPEGKLVAVFNPQENFNDINNSIPTFNQAWLYKDITATIDYLNLKSNS
ncbi:SCO family protein [Thalassotalea fonticola]|uniref:SCO family protein n=1 Tax=Thalassotalea fonticola TaxID=3065649 RepID=A0ABZ0GRT2_9GAMM|nr:SCO family protein [Colwelliaceae bacterium S1-1]